MELTELEVELLIKELSRKLFKKEFDLPVKRNNRLRRAQARFRAKHGIYERIPLYIECSKKIYDGTYKLNTTIGILTHELCHWWLFINNKNYRDVDLEFKELLKKFGAPASVKSVGLINRFSCSECGKFIIATSSTKYSNHRYYTKCCHAHLISEKMYVEDNNSINLKFDTMNLEIVQDLLNRKMKKAQ